MDIIELLGKFGVLAVSSGILASLICGVIKLPIITKIKAKNLDGKETTKRIENACFIVTTALSFIFIAVYYYITERTFGFIKSGQFYGEVFMAMTVAKLTYGTYEATQLKALIHNIITSIREKMATLPAEEKDSIKELAEIAKNVISTKYNLPLTISQQDTFIEDIIAEVAKLKK